ncbi:hypothetical protein [Sphingomonas montana]|uniref:hypothetical protein n=1 Tax=Sphingomonas montana TaxID=1843236 RepID=UPI00096CDB6B|nr:hypothetical protein [Sphingomonas montana]
MGRTVKFVLIVTLVSGLTSFLLTFLTATGQRSQSDPTFIGLVFGMTAGVAFLLLSGNRRIPLADDATRRAVLAEPAAAGAARLLIVRESKVGMMVGVDVEVDGAVVTQLRSPRFAAVTVSPGRHACVAIAQGRRSAPLAIDAEAGGTVVLRISTGFGGIKLTREDDSPALRTALAKVPMVAPA